MQNKDPERVAHIIGKWLGGGVESVVMNYYRHIDHSNIQFDFICDEDSTDIPYEEIEKLGGRVILIPPYQKVFKYHKELKRVLKEGNYKIVHSHINTLSVFSLFAAWDAKIPIRIAHSHSTTNKKEWKKNFIKLLLRPFAKFFATNYMACTEHAGRWMFGNKNYNKGKVFVLNNAIDLEKYSYDENSRNSIRKKLGIDENVVVIGHIGRFVEQKNHRLILNIFDEFHKERPNSKLLLIGQGPLMKEIEEQTKKMKINDSVIFLGQIENVNEYYNAMDLFLFPSLYEGLGLVLIEAQTNGLPCIASTEVPAIAKVSDLLKFVSLENKVEEWSKEIISSIKRKRKKIDIKKIENQGFSITKESKIIVDYYYNLIESHEKTK